MSTDEEREAVSRGAASAAQQRAFRVNLKRAGFQSADEALRLLCSRPTDAAQVEKRNEFIRLLARPRKSCD